MKVCFRLYWVHSHNSLNVRQIVLIYTSLYLLEIQQLNNFGVGAVFAGWDLGVFVTTNFKPSRNARLAVSRARVRLFQIRRGFVVMMKEAFFSLYLSLVRPILEDAIQAISPYLQKDIARK